MKILKDLLRFELEYAMSGIEFRLGGTGRTIGAGNTLAAPYESIIRACISLRY